MSERSHEHTIAVVILAPGARGDEGEIASEGLSGARCLAVAPGRGPSPECAWRALSAGADDVLPCDQSPEQLGTIAARLRRWLEVEEMLRTAPARAGLAGSCRVWRAVLRQVIEIARYSTIPILLTGESGTGKEGVARLIHDLDGRPEKRELVVVDCGTIAPELSASELFGHERGAFTSAHSTREGAVAQADGGTLFLDEVGELPARVQAELLRALQEGVYKAIGSNAWRRSSFRVVCATNRDLAEERGGGRFRTDLYYRLSAWECRLPTLEERREDIPEIVRALMSGLRAGAAPALDPLVSLFLGERAYPGNVRELRNLVAAMLARYAGHGPITLGCLPPAEAAAFRARGREGFGGAVRAALAEGKTLDAIRTEVVDSAYRQVLEEASGDTSVAGSRLGVTARAVQLWRKERGPALGPGPA